MYIYIGKGDNFNLTAGCRSSTGYKKRRWKRRKGERAWRSREYGCRGLRREGRMSRSFKGKY
jgi:hypothetical protein